MDPILAKNHAHVVRGLNGLSDACGGMAALRRSISVALRDAERAEDETRVAELGEFKDRLSQATEGLVRAIAKIPEECWDMWFEAPGTVGGAEVRERVQSELECACAEV
jgi:hypothetical protein